MKETLHHRVKEAGVAPILHRECHPPSLLEDISTFKQLGDGGWTRLFNLTLKIIFILLPLFSFQFKLAPPFRTDTARTALGASGTVSNFSKVLLWKELGVSSESRGCSRPISLAPRLVEGGAEIHLAHEGSVTAAATSTSSVSSVRMLLSSLFIMAAHKFLKIKG